MKLILMHQNFFVHFTQISFYLLHQDVHIILYTYILLFAFFLTMHAFLTFYRHVAYFLFFMTTFFYLFCIFLSFLTIFFHVFVFFTNETGNFYDSFTNNRLVIYQNLSSFPYFSVKKRTTWRLFVKITTHMILFYHSLSMFTISDISV